MSKGRNTTVVGIRLQDEVVTKLKRLARSRRVTVSDLLRPLIATFAIRGSVSQTINSGVAVLDYDQNRKEIKEEIARFRAVQKQEEDTKRLNSPDASSRRERLNEPSDNDLPGSQQAEKKQSPVLKFQASPSTEARLKARAKRKKHKHGR